MDLSNALTLMDLAYAHFNIVLKVSKENPNTKIGLLIFCLIFELLFQPLLPLKEHDTTRRKYLLFGMHARGRLRILSKAGKASIYAAMQNTKAAKTIFTTFSGEVFCNQ